MRVTQNQMTKQYLNNSATALENMNKINNRILTQRKFTKASEDSVGAAKALKIRSNLERNDMYNSNLETADGILGAGEGALMNMSSVITTVSDSILNAINSTNNETNVNILAESIRNCADELVAQMNTDYLGRYIFGGTNNSSPAFTFDEGTGKLSYNGTDVSTGDITAYTNNKPIYVDIGRGIKFDENGVVDPQTTLDISLSGIEYTGYGTDEDGDSKNLIQLVYDAAAALEEGDADKARRLHGKIDEAKTELMIGITNIGNKEKTIELSLERNKDDKLSLQKAQNTVETADVTEEITNWKVAQMAYNATLSMGGMVIPNSIFDFIR